MFRAMAPLKYQAGQFAQLQVPGTETWRNYSYAHPADGRDELEFIIRLLPDGVMSNYLRDRAKPGDRIAIAVQQGQLLPAPDRAANHPGGRRHRPVGDPGDGRQPRLLTPGSRSTCSTG